MAMTPDITIKSGDRLPVLTRTIEIGGIPLNLTGGTAMFQAVTPAAPTLYVINSSAVIDPDQTNNTGVVSYAWSATDAALAQGYYLARFVVTLAGKSLTAPNDGWLVMFVSGATLGSFTYSGDPSSSDRDTVRFLIQDTDSTDPLVSDSEIAYLLNAAAANVYQAAHDACTTISARFARKADTSKSVGDLSLSQAFGNRAEEYRKLGDAILDLGVRRDPPRIWADPQSLKATADRLITTHNTDYWLGQMDYKGR